MNNFEYVGSGKISISSNTVYVVESRETYVKIYTRVESLVKQTPESTYSYYSSRLKNIVFDLTSFLSPLPLNNQRQHNISLGGFSWQ